MPRKLIGYKLTNPQTGEIRVCRTLAEANRIQEWWYVVDKLRELERIKLLRRLLEEKRDQEKQG